MEVYDDEDLEFSDYGRYPLGLKLLSCWALLLTACALFDGMVLIFFLKVIHHIR